MDSKVVKLLKIYENETGKELLSKLTKDRLKKLAFYYDNLSEDEQQDIDLKIITGEGNDFIDVCLGLAGFYDEVEYDQGLKDLTEEVIEEESGGSTALAVIPRTTETTSDQDLVGEDIDPRILKLLGLEDVFDIDYDTYKSLLREKMAAGRMTDSQIPTEEVELLTDEFKRVKQKTGRFTVKKKTINADSFFDRGEAAETETSDKPVVTPAGLLPSSEKISKTVEQEQTEVNVEEQDNFNQKVLAPSLQKIDDNIQNILDTLKRQYDLDKKEAQRDQRIANKTKRDKRETKLEGGDKSKGLSLSSLKNIAAPVFDLFDMMNKFIINTLLGGLVMRVMDIINDPNKYLNPIKQFFINIIKWVEDTVQFIVDIPYNIYNSIAGNLNGGIEAIENAINNALEFFKQAPMEPGARLPILEAPNIEIPIPDMLKLQPTNADSQAQSQTGGGEVTTNPATVVTNNFLLGSPAMPADTSQGNTTMEVSPSLSVDGVSVAPPGPTPIDVSMGGRIENRSMNKVKGMGVDTQLVAAEPGEIMVNRPAVQMIGAENLLAANAMAAGGGANKPKFGKFMGMQGGGMIGRQGSAPIRDFGLGGSAGKKGYVLVPGHAAGGGAPGEMEMVVDLTQNVVDNLKNRFGNDIPIKIMNMHAQTANTDAAFSKQQDQLKELEKQGYEVIEIHMDASLESGKGTGRGLIAPMPGTDAINPVEADFARTAGAFEREHRGGLAATDRGVSIIELGNMSPELQKKYDPNQVQGTPGIDKEHLDIITKPLEDSLMRGMKLKTSADVVGSDFTIGSGAVDAFDSTGSSPSVTPRITSTPAASVTATQVYSKAPNKQQNVQLIPLPQGGGEKPVTSSAQANQKAPPPLNAEDANNFDMIVIKSIYNIVN